MLGFSPSVVCPRHVEVAITCTYIPSQHRTNSPPHQYSLYRTFAPTPTLPPPKRQHLSSHVDTPRIHTHAPRSFQIAGISSACCNTLLPLISFPVLPIAVVKSSIAGREGPQMSTSCFSSETLYALAIKGQSVFCYVGRAWCRCPSFDS